MYWMFNVITDRLKAMFVTDVALDFETQLASRQAERKAELLRQAARFEDEGLDTVAADLRNQAEVITIERPLASVLPAIDELRDYPREVPVAPVIPVPGGMNGGAAKRLPAASTAKTGRKRKVSGRKGR